MSRPKSGMQQQVKQGTYYRNRQIYSQWKQGEPQGKIALAFGISRQAVYKIIKTKERELCQNLKPPKESKKKPESSTTTLTSDTPLPTSEAPSKELMDSRSPLMVTTVQ